MAGGPPAKKVLKRRVRDRVYVRVMELKLSNLSSNFRLAAMVVGQVILVPTLAN